MPLDDLPRSPTGRVPQWVLDEAAGRAAPPPPWRAPAGPSRPANGPGGPRRGRTARQVLRAIATGTFLVLVIGFAVAYQVSPAVKGAVGGAVVADPADAPRTAPPVGHEEEDSRLAPAPPAVPGQGGYAFIGTQTAATAIGAPVTWSPCRPIHYVVRTDGAPAAFPDEVRRAVAAVAAASGLTFVDDGTTDEPDSDVRPLYQPDRYGERWAPVLIRFADESQLADLRGSVAGVASPRAVADRYTGQTRYVSGEIVIDTEVVGAVGTGGTPAYREVLLHELGHLVGLDHVDDTQQMMYPTAAGRVGFGAGDLAGLSALGQGGCAPGV